MHELSLCQSLLEQATTIAAQHRANAIAAVTVHIGPLSGVETGLFARAFEVVRQGTLASDAALTITKGVLVIECATCGARSMPPANRLRCLNCDDFRVKIIEGQELLLASLELDITEVPHVQ